ncbi:hypothetical protein SRABI106_04546 [Rahnella aquatilis]|nr:hypothetical protein SRABI106_04546 [Rahnella aquatilis]
MKKLTLEKAQEILEFLQGKAVEGDITLAQENYLQAMELAVKALSAKQDEMPDKALSLSETIGELRKYIDSSGGYDFEALRSEHVNSPVIPDRSMLRNLVDLVWNEAKESTEVPSTKFADQLIDKVFPISTAKPELL